MDSKTIAETLKNLSQEYLDGDIELEIYRPLCGALIFSLMGFSPEQTASILDKAKLEILVDVLERQNDVD